MKIPYNVIHVSGDVIFAARGGRIHAFAANGGAHLSTWKHPDVDKAAALTDAATRGNGDDEKAVGAAPEANEEADRDEPPAKRQKVEETSSAVETADGGKLPQDSSAKPSGKKSKDRQKNQNRVKEGQNSHVPDRPIITHLTSTADGKHLVAVTGHDKNVWVFGHDGSGQLNKLSQRAMPKRPSALAIGPDSQIITGDKFGDVYALPLIPTLKSPSSKHAAPVEPAQEPVQKIAATTLTVHSQRNRRALENQQRHLELATRTKAVEQARREVPDFELTLLLGHVSMLTAMVLGESDGRYYILTGDRDEHIRVSRYLPQAYVIEGFCLGHEEFIGAMAMPPTRSDVLVSGGGDESLLVWDWKASKLLSKTSILSLAKEISPELTKVAVSRVYTMEFSTEKGASVYVLAICEDVQAIFSWQLASDNTLHCPAVIQLPGKPLDVASISGNSDQPSKLVVAIDPGESAQAKSLCIYELTAVDGKLATGPTTLMDDAAFEVEEPDITEKEVRGLLYATEKLRKLRDEGEGEEELDTPGQGTPAADDL